MGIIFVIVFSLIFVVAFNVGCSMGRAQLILRLQQENNKVVQALHKVEKLAQLKGENLNQLSQEELLKRIDEQIKLSEESDA